MNILETEWWSMCLPPEWWAESEEESILVGDRDDVGCIEISHLHKREGSFQADEIEQMARDQADQKLTWKAVTLGDFAGVNASFTEEGAAIREWYVASDALLLYITYSCDEDNGGLDDAAVDEILATLLLGGAPSDAAPSA